MTNRRSALVAKSVALAAAMATAGTMLAACGSGGSSGSADGKTTIRLVWWGNDARAAATQKAVQQFEQANPKIKVETEFSDYGSYVQKLTTQVAANAAPDIIQLDRPTFGEYVSKHVLANMQSYVDSKKLDLSKVDAGLLSGEQYDGDQYAVPAGQTTQMFVYNADAFQKAGIADPANGWTWQQFEDDLAKLKKSTGKAGVTDLGWAIDWFDTWLHQRGKSVYTTDGKLGFTTDDLTQFWTYTDGLRKAGLATPAEVTTKQDGSTATSALISGDAAIEENYDSNLAGYIAATKTHLKAAPLPTDTPGAETSGLAALPPVYFGIPASSKKKDAAIKLLNFLVNDTQAGATLGTSRGVPPNTAIREQVCGSAAPADKQTCAYEQQVASNVGPSKTWAWPMGSSAVKADFQKVYDTVVFGKASPAQAAAQLVSDAKDSIEQ